METYRAPAKAGVQFRRWNWAPAFAGARTFVWAWQRL